VANGTATITITDKKGNTQSVTVTVKLGPSGIITFSPGSPFNFAAGLAPDQFVTISEAGYSGSFSVTACAGTGNPCGVSSGSGYTNANCANGSPGNQNALTAAINVALPTELVLSTNPQGSAAALSCTVTVSDSFGNHADYTFTAPNTVPSGIIIISPNTVTFGPGQQSFEASVSESGYFGGFSIQSCGNTGSGTCALSGGVATCTGGSPPNLIVMNATLAAAANATTLAVADNPQGTGLPMVTCVLTIVDTLGNQGNFTFTAPAQ
jgi:hypothetical protein